mmetsp:Transcript_118476/g.342568  ORF Transcript_118476/g.342568 Transcript_118476/m.342568 type:complete len:718 (-) Transcript_118476:121-2274(-)
MGGMGGMGGMGSMTGMGGMGGMAGMPGMTGMGGMPGMQGMCGGYSQGMASPQGGMGMSPQVGVSMTMPQASMSMHGAQMYDGGMGMSQMGGMLGMAGASGTYQQQAPAAPAAAPSQGAGGFGAAGGAGGAAGHAQAMKHVMDSLSLVGGPGGQPPGGFQGTATQPGANAQASPSSSEQPGGALTGIDAFASFGMTGSASPSQQQSQPQPQQQQHKVTFQPERKQSGPSPTSLDPPPQERGYRDDAWEYIEATSIPSSDMSGIALQETSLNDNIGDRLRKQRSACLDWLISQLGEAQESSVCYRTTHRPCFGLIGLFMTVLNCVILAVEAEINNYEALGRALGREIKGDLESVKTSLYTAQQCFLVWLCIEVLLGVLGSRAAYFVGKNWQWNLVDVLILCGSFLELAATGMNLSYIRFLRVLRGSRAMQAVRFIRFSHSLQKMTSAVASVAAALFWSACLIFIVMYIFGLAMMEGVSTYINEQILTSGPVSALDTETTELLRDLESQYGGMGTTMTTLARAISGADWGVFATSLGETGWAWAFVWILYILIIVFGMLNVLTGIVVDIVRKPLVTDRTLQLLVEAEEERSLCEMLSFELEKIGKDPGAYITRKAFDMIMERASVKKFLREFGINIDRVQDMFYLIDADHRGKITAKMAAQRFLELRGDAKAQDIQRLSRDIGMMKKHLEDMAHTSRDMLWYLHGPQEEEIYLDNGAVVV